MPTRLVCGNTIKYPTQTSTTCTVGCNANTAQMCGDSSGVYFSVYSSLSLKKDFFLKWLYFKILKNVQ